MTAHVFTGAELTINARRKPSELVEDYNAKLEMLPSVWEAFNRAGDELKSAATLHGAWGNTTIDTGSVYLRTLEASLLKSAWRCVYQEHDLATIASAQDKRRLERLFEDPPAFTMDNIRETFGALILDPMSAVLRGMAEVFADLDPAFRSHEKVKIGVKGLPKRVIIRGVGGIYGGGEDQIRDILNAMAAYSQLPLITHAEMTLLLKDGNALRDGGTFTDPFASRYEIKNGTAGEITVIGRGVWLKIFQNGNGHLFFSPEALRTVNKALAEFYGDVLADCPEDDEARPAPSAGTDVAKDLQYYPTPKALAQRAAQSLGSLEGKAVLDPNCGCGRLLAAARDAGASKVFGVEYSGKRAMEARGNGFNVLHANFLTTVPEPVFDVVLMNPPFYGKHYAKHVRHALGFLRPGGKLVSILPATARYDHGLLDDLRPLWEDLPVGAFRESGTNVCVSIATIFQK